MPDLTINYAHAWETMQKGIDDRGPYYQVSYRFANWSDSDNVANQLRGITSRSGGVTYRTGPHQHPLSPNLLCNEVRIEGCGNAILNSSGLPNYDGGFLAHCIYRALPLLPYASDDPYGNNQIDPTTVITWATQELDYETETIPLDETNTYKWSSGPLSGQTTGIPVNVKVNVTTMVITFHQLPYLPMTVVRSKRNQINSSTFLGAAAETIWFKGARTTRDLNTDGTISQKVQMVFQERDVSWNKLLMKDGTWQYATTNGGANLFNTTDLSPLITL